MPTDLQLIDGFEKLREEFNRENPPPAGIPARQRLEGMTAEHWVVDSWLQAVEPKLAGSGSQQLRQLRYLVRQILEGAPPAPGGPLKNGNVSSWLPGIPGALDQARRAGLWPLNEAEARRTAAEEAKEWNRILPGLQGLRAWRFMERLGWPVIVPDRRMRRFLWRLGVLEETEADDARPQQVLSVLEKMAALSGMPFPMFSFLLRWHTGGDRELAGGKWCARKPRCAPCPFHSACTWARFNPELPANHNGRSDRDRLQPLLEKVAAGRRNELQEAELIAVLLQRGAAGTGVFEISDALLHRFGNLRGLEQASTAELASVGGMSLNRAAQLKAALEMGRRAAAEALRQGNSITCSEDIWNVYRARFRHLPQEHFVIVLLDAKNRPIHDHIVSKGTLTGSLAHPREVFQEAIRHSAAGIILLHNHPSGDPAPSREDRAVTTRLKEAGEILGIKVLDHIILGADGYYSFKDEDKF